MGNKEPVREVFEVLDDVGNEPIAASYDEAESIKVARAFNLGLQVPRFVVVRSLIIAGRVH